MGLLQIANPKNNVQKAGRGRSQNASLAAGFGCWLLLRFYFTTDRIRLRRMVWLRKAQATSCAAAVCLLFFNQTERRNAATMKVARRPESPLVASAEAKSL